VFGSFARQEGDSSSDIDVLIVGTPSDDDVADLADLVERWTGNRAQVVVLAPDEYRRVVQAEEPVTKEWDRDLHVVVGDPAVVAAGRTGR
jgi:predicted nucleotidyltransferase